MALKNSFKFTDSYAANSFGQVP